MIIGINGYAGSGKDTVGTIIQYLTSDAYKEGRSYEKYLERSTNPVAFGMIYQHTWEIKKWAGKLKEIASILTNIPINKFEDQDFKKTELSSEWDIIEETMPCGCDRFMDWYHKDGKCANCDEPTQITRTPMTIRELLQRLGTDAMRVGLHTNTWVNALMSEYVMNKEHFNDIANGREVGDGYPKWIITDTRFPNEAQAIKDKGGILIRVNRKGVNPINNHPSEVGIDNWDFDHIIDNNGSINELIESVKLILNNYGK